MYCSLIEFSITDLCNSSADCWCDIFSFLLKLQEVFSSRKLWNIEASLRWYPSYFRFLTLLNALSHNIVSEAVLLVKS